MSLFSRAHPISKLMRISFQVFGRPFDRHTEVKRLSIHTRICGMHRLSPATVSSYHDHLAARINDASRKTNWTTTEITVRMGRGDPGSKSLDSDTSGRNREPITYMSGARQSKRIRLAKEGIRRKKLTVTKSMTVKEIKMEVGVLCIYSEHKALIS